VLQAARFPRTLCEAPCRARCVAPPAALALPLSASPHTWSWGPACRGRGAPDHGRRNRQLTKLGLFPPATAFTIDFVVCVPTRLPLVELLHVLSLVGVLGITIVLFLTVAVTAKVLFDS
jgi:hypothetical protein